MRKGIKKTIKSFFIVVTILLLLLTFFSVLLSNSSVQTFLTERYTRSLQQNYDIDVSVGSVNLKLFNRLVVEDILARDHNSDTLLYVPHTTIRFRENRGRRDELAISRVVFNQPQLSITTDHNNINNLSLFISKLTSANKNNSKKDRATFSLPTLRIRESEVINGTVAVKNFGNEEEKEDGTINFNNLAIKDINLLIKDIVHGASLSELALTELSFVEKSGFKLKNVSTKLIVADSLFLFSPTTITTSTTSINFPEISISLPQSSTNVEHKEIDSVDNNGMDRSLKYVINIAESVVSGSDIAFFLSPFSNLNQDLILSGEIEGTSAEFHGYNLNLRFNDRTGLLFDVDIDDVKDIANSSFFASINRLTADANDFEWFLSDSANLTIAPFARRIGTLSVSGQFSSSNNKYMANSDIATDYGSLRVDVSLDRDSTNFHKVEGSLFGQSLLLGHILDNYSLFQQADFYINVNGNISPQFDSYSGDISGTIDSVSIKNYTYRNISMNGSLSENRWNGDIHINENNLKLDLIGLLDFNRQQPQFNFVLDLDTANLFQLHIDTDSTSVASLMLEADFVGNNVDNLNGTIKLTDAHFFRNETDLFIDTLLLETLSSDTLITTIIKSDFVDGTIEGYYNIDQLATILTNTYKTLFPSLTDNSKKGSIYGDNNLHFNAQLRNSNIVNDFFGTGIHTANDISVEGSLLADNTISISASIDTISYLGLMVDSLTLMCDYHDSCALINLSGNSIQMPYLSSLKNVALELTILPDSMQLDVLWDNKEIVHRSGEIKVESQLVARDSLPTFLTIFIEPSKIFTNNNIWNLKKSNITIDTTSVYFNSIVAESETGFYHLNGTISDSPSDTLLFNVKGINLEPVDAIIRSLPRKRPKNPKAPFVNLRGYLSGDVKLSNLYNSPIVNGTAQIEQFSLLDTKYNLGTLSLQSFWNNEQKQLDIAGTNIKDNSEVLNIGGYYAPSRKEIDIDIVATHLQGDVLNTLLKSFATDVSGTVSGELKFAGIDKDMALTGALIAENTNLKVGITQVNYTVNDTIFFEKERISLGRLEAVDSRGRVGYISGNVTHQMFANMKADINVEVDNVLVFNTKAKENPDIYGTIYATGMASIKTDGPYTELTVSAQTNSNTRLYIPLSSSAQKVSSYSFISFANNDNILIQPAINNQINRNIKSGTKVNLDLNITPDAKIQLIFDSATDAITASGSGDLTINLLENGTLQMFGTYTISEGSYLFTMGNLLSKSFSVNEGGTISFNGDIENISMDIEAVYSTRASLYEILQDENYSQRERVNCLLKISGSLTSPIIEFGIDLPDADSEVKSYLSSIISTEEELSKQFVYLLVMNSFYATSGTRNVASTSTSALSATTTEMLFNQVGNWLSQINEDFDVGFLYTPDNTNINQQDFQVMLSTQLLDNRMTINGDFGYQGNSSIGAAGSEHITGDFDIKYKLTDRIKLKAFNRYNSPYSGRRANSYTQGVGLFYEKDFDSVADLFRRKKRKNK